MLHFARNEENAIAGVEPFKEDLSDEGPFGDKVIDEGNENADLFFGQRWCNHVRGLSSNHG
jgi:hypothetical protein